MTTTKSTERGAVLQFEIDRKRWDAADIFGGFEETMTKRLHNIARTAVRDTILHGGTFVLVATPDKITMIQRPDAAEEL